MIGRIFMILFAVLLLSGTTTINKAEENVIIVEQSEDTVVQVDSIINKVETLNNLLIELDSISNEKNKNK